MHKPSKEQIMEWTESPVTIELKTLLLVERREAREARSVDAYHPFQPQRTQEVLANLNGAIESLDLVIAALDGEGLLEIEDDSDEIEDARFE